MRPFYALLGGLASLLWFCAHGQSTTHVMLTTLHAPNGTHFFLEDALSDVLLDSAQVQNNQVTLTATYRGGALMARLYEKDKRSTSYISFWMVPGTLTVEQTDSTLASARVTGNEHLLAQESTLDGWLVAVEKKMDKLDNRWDKKMKRIDRKIKKVNQQMERHYAQEAMLEKEEAQVQRNYIRAYPQQMYSVYLLSINKIDWGADTVKALLQLLPDSLVSTSYGESIVRYTRLAAPTTVGAQAPDIRQPSPLGDTLTLSSLLGKWVLLEFWASWCGPCRQENPALVATYEALKDKNFEVFAVSLDKNKAAWRKAIERDELPWLHVSELNEFDNSAAFTYSVNEIPNNIVIDPSGKIIARDLHGFELRMFLEKKINPDVQPSFFPMRRNVN